MFESAELGHKIDKATYDKEVPTLREALLEDQLDLAKAVSFQVIFLIGGVGDAVRGVTVNQTKNCQVSWLQRCKNGCSFLTIMS